MLENKSVEDRGLSEVEGRGLRVVEVPTPLNKENNYNYQKLVAQIEAGVGVLNLLIAVCDDLKLRDRLIEEYEAELKPDLPSYGVKIDREEPSLRFAIAQLVEKEDYLSQGGKAVLTVTGAEDIRFISLDGERTPQEKLFGYLQWTREGLLAFPYPIVFWITKQIFVNLRMKAPDFWSWRNGVFHFVEETPVVTVPQQENQWNIQKFEEEMPESLIPLEELEQLIARTEKKRGEKDRSLATLYNSLGETYYGRVQRGEAENYLDEREKAVQCFRKAIALQTEFSLQFYLVNSLRNLGNVYYLQGRYKEAREYYQKSLGIAREIGDRSGEGKALVNMGNVLSCLGLYEEARKYYQKSLEISREIGDRFREAGSLLNLGNIYYSQELHQEAIKYYQQSLEISREIGDRFREAGSLLNLGNIYYSQGLYQGAIEYYQKSLEISREIGDRLREAESIFNLGNVYYSQELHQEAIEYYQQSLEISREIGALRSRSLRDRLTEAESLLNLGNVYYSQELYQEAIDYVQQSLVIFREIGDRFREAASLLNLGNVYYSQELYQEAIDYVQQSLVIFREIGDRKNENICLNKLRAAEKKLQSEKQITKNSV